MANTCTYKLYVNNKKIVSKNNFHCFSGLWFKIKNNNKNLLVIDIHSSNKFTYKEVDKYLKILRKVFPSVKRKQNRIYYRPEYQIESTVFGMCIRYIWESQDGFPDIVNFVLENYNNKTNNNVLNLLYKGQKNIKKRYYNSNHTLFSRRYVLKKHVTNEYFQKFLKIQTNSVTDIIENKINNL